MNNFLKSKRFLYIAIFIAVIILDQVSKIWVKTNMSLGSSIWITDWFQINFQENNGMAFSIEMGNKIFLTLFRIIAVGGLLYIINKLIIKAFASLCKTRSYKNSNTFGIIFFSKLGCIMHRTSCFTYTRIKIRNMNMHRPNISRTARSRRTPRRDWDRSPWDRARNTYW